MGKIISSDLKIYEVKESVKKAKLEIVNEKKLLNREPKFSPIPAQLNNKLRKYLLQKFPNGLYSHQSEGINTLLNGKNVGLSTTTASGKSLVYMTAVTEMIMRDEKTKVLALYPARALIQDQKNKWKEFKQFGISIGYIDGGVLQIKREDILKEHNVVLMTPDVAHTWLLRNAGISTVSNFLDDLKLLILDEAHVYEGAFGTNMAYFIRRLDAVTFASFQIIISTATLGEPDKFFKELTGYNFHCFTETEDGSRVTSKKLLLLKAGDLTQIAILLSELAKKFGSPFLAFADSRKQVEHLAAISVREKKKKEEKIKEHKTNNNQLLEGILPYRAGYENNDRLEIQKALQQGMLKGVISTSALELGLDIGDINLVILLTTPPSIKAFKQRIGRGGRSRPGIYLILDSEGTIVAQGLDNYLKRNNEPNYLYLHNRYIQYANVLCAAWELEQRGGKPLKRKSFDSLPEKFISLLDNEIKPVDPVPEDLFSLKQRGEAGPHFEFPLRNEIEKQFKVKGTGPPGENSLGTLGFSLVLREAYPGGIYYYLANPYRVKQFNYRKGEIIVKPERYWTTKPISQSIVFPNFQEGVYQYFVTKDKRSFVIESHIQVSERVTGFYEKRGSAQAEKHEYGIGSPYYQRSLNNFFETTGVSIYFAGDPKIDQITAKLIKKIFCREFGILERDLGAGYFTGKFSLFGEERVSGVCIYDATSGSLRLTKILAENFKRVTKATLDTIPFLEDLLEEENINISAIEKLDEIATNLKKEILYSSQVQIAAVLEEQESESEGKAFVIAPGEKATSIIDSRDVIIKGYRYTPNGIMYDLEHPEQQNLNRWALPEDKIRPIYGETKMLLVNLFTGEEEFCGFFSKLPG